MQTSPPTFAALLASLALLCGCDAFVSARGGVVPAPLSHVAGDSSAAAFMLGSDSVFPSSLSGVRVELFRHLADADSSTSGAKARPFASTVTDSAGRFHLWRQCDPLACGSFYLVVTAPGYHTLIRQVRTDSLWLAPLRVTLAPSAYPERLP